MQSNLPEEALRDPMGPPKTPIEVRCIECDKTYESSKMIWEDRGVGKGGRGFWCCPTPGCGGMGFGFDIWPVDQNYRDEQTGELFFRVIEDEDDEDEDLAADDVVSNLEPASGKEEAHHGDTEARRKD